MGSLGAKMGPKLKDQEIRWQVSTLFSVAPQSELTLGERILVVAHCNLVLFFFVFGPTCLTFGPILRATVQR